MQNTPSTPGTRDLAFLIAGLMDSLLGGLFLLAWLNLLPVDLVGLGIPRWLAGVLGVMLSLSGLVVFTYQLTKLKEPE